LGKFLTSRYASNSATHRQQAEVALFQPLWLPDIIFLAVNISKAVRKAIRLGSRFSLCGAERADFGH
jgi:hypothetical protein